MKKEQLYEAMPIKLIKEADVERRLLEETEVIAYGRAFVSRLSMNRYLKKPLVEFTLEEGLNLFTVLQQESYAVKQNPLHLSEVEVKELEPLLQREFQLESPYKLDDFYVERLLSGEDLDLKKIDVHGEVVDLTDVLEQFVFQDARMNMMESASVMLMLVVKKALLTIHLAEENIQRLVEGKRAIYDVAILN